MTGDAADRLLRSALRLACAHEARMRTNKSDSAAVQRFREALDEHENEARAFAGVPVAPAHCRARWIQGLCDDRPAGFCELPAGHAEDYHLFPGGNRQTKDRK